MLCVRYKITFNIRISQTTNSWILCSFYSSMFLSQFIYVCAGEHDFTQHGRPYGRWINNYHCNQCPITTEVAISNPIHGKVNLIRHYVIKFVSDLRQVGGFLRILWFYWNIVESDVKHHNHNPHKADSLMFIKLSITCFVLILEKHPIRMWHRLIGRFWTTNTKLAFTNYDRGAARFPWWFNITRPWHIHGPNRGVFNHKTQFMISEIELHRNSYIVLNL